MSNIAALLKLEIARVARREVRAQTEQLHRASARFRGDIAKLKKELAQAYQVIRRLERAKPAVAHSQEEPESKTHRFSAPRLAALRAKLGLTAREMAQLIGVSQLSIYKWEQGKTRPRPAQVAAIAAVRTIGKREARARLQGGRR